MIGQLDWVSFTKTNFHHLGQWQYQGSQNNVCVCVNLSLHIKIHFFIQFVFSFDYIGYNTNIEHDVDKLSYLWQRMWVL